MPARLLGLDPLQGTGPYLAVALGLLTVFSMFAWERWRPAVMRLVPGALVGILLATLLAYFGGFDVARVVVPEKILSSVVMPGGSFFARFLEPAILTAALAIAFIASAEILLSAAALDRMHSGVRTDYDKELRAQGVGNLLCGFAGALPMTGVIVRSSAKVQAGAATRLSTVLHGPWILGFVMLLPWLLREVPMAALGGILVVTGCRLVALKHVRHLFDRYGIAPALIWAATLITVVAADLLTGVKPSKALESVPQDRPMKLELAGLGAIDHICAEMPKDWLQRRRAAGMRIELLRQGTCLGLQAA